MFGLTKQTTVSNLTSHRLQRLVTLGRAAALVIALLSVASYVILDRTLQVQHDCATAIGLTRERLLVERISQPRGADAARTGTRRGLRDAIDALTTNQQRIVHGDAGEYPRPVGADALDRLITAYALQARRVASLSAHDPSAAATAAALRAAQAPLLDALDSAVAAREADGRRSAPLLRRLGAATSLGLLATLLGSALGFVRPLVGRVRDQARDLAQIAELATTDPLTGMLNRRGFQNRCAIEIHKAKRYDRPLSLLVVDPDGFGAINSAHGRGGGETVLKALTATLVHGTRMTDLVGRVGDEEFAILLPETDCGGAKLLAERLRARISELAVPLEHAVVSCTVSIGVAAAEKNAELFWPTFKRADEALYEAKMRGRNRVFVNAA